MRAFLIQIARIKKKKKLPAAAEKIEREMKKLNNNSRERDKSRLGSSVGDAACRKLAIERTLSLAISSWDRFVIRIQESGKRHGRLANASAIRRCIR